MPGSMKLATPEDFKEIDDFDKITDYVTAVKLLKSWSISTNGVGDKQEAVHRLINYWLELKQHRPSSEQLANDRDAEAGSCEQNRTRKGLVEKCQQAEKFYSELPRKVQNSLLKAFPEFLEKLKTRKEVLCSGESAIIVAGEVGAGKSSLINLLLGEELLPTHGLRCTNTICEIRNSGRGKKQAIAYLKGSSDGDNNSSVRNCLKIDLGNQKGIADLQGCIMGANDYDDSPYEKVKIYWPFDRLGDGIVIVDTPGVQGGNSVDMILQQYLSKAFGFIYVINTNIAGGVQHNRLGALLKMVVNSAEDFSPEASLFIGNKWENIPEKDKRAVQNDIHTKLKKVYPGIKEEQIQYMSVKECKEMFLSYKEMRNDHKTLLSKIEQLSYDSLRKGMNGHYTWLSSFLNKALHLIRVANNKVTLSKEELREECKNLTERIQRLQRATDESISELRRKIDYHIYKISQDISELLPSRTMMDSLCVWSEDTCVKRNKKWKLVAEEASCVISKRIQQAVDAWEEKYGILKEIDEQIVEVFSKEFGLMEHHIFELEESMYKSRNRNDSLCKTTKTVPIKTIFKTKMKKIEKTYRTLGGAVSCIGGLDTSKKSVRKVFKDYDKDAPGAMANATVLYVETILQQKDFPGKLRKFFNRYFMEIDAFVKRIPAFLQADQQMIETVSQKLDENIAISEKYPGLHDSCKTILSELDTFYVNYIMKFDYELSSISYETGEEARLGSGSFADVYVGVLKSKGKEVALKITKDIINKSNITDILMEDRIMRDLQHKNVVRYFGASFKRKREGIKWIMVMERYGPSFKQLYITTRNARIPGDFLDGHPDRGEAVHEMVTRAQQICDGLAYIHEKGYTHRDLKMENILMGLDDQVKLMDVGFAQPTNLLTDSLIGSPAYMAPEVVLSSGNQDNSVDIYSLSFILWEMWYGRDVANIINKEVLGIGFRGDAMSLFKARQAKDDGGFRPPLTMANKPPEKLVNILKASWSADRLRRPSAVQLLKFFKTFLETSTY